MENCIDCGFLYLVANEEDNFTISVNSLRKSSRKDSKNTDLKTP